MNKLYLLLLLINIQFIFTGETSDKMSYEQMQDMVQGLLKSGTIDAEDEDGYTPLIDAVSNGNSGLVEMLLANKADVNHIIAHSYNMDDDYDSLEGDTALIFAVQHSKPKIVDILLKHGANINYENQKDSYATPLKVAAERGNTDLVKMLLKNKADIANDCLSLVPAIENRHFVVAKILLDYGANIDQALNHYFELREKKVSDHSYYKFIDRNINDLSYTEEINFILDQYYERYINYLNSAKQEIDRLDILPTNLSPIISEYLDFTGYIEMRLGQELSDDRKKIIDNYLLTKLSNPKAQSNQEMEDYE